MDIFSRAPTHICPVEMCGRFGIIIERAEEKRWFFFYRASWGAAKDQFQINGLRVPPSSRRSNLSLASLREVTIELINYSYSYRRSK